MADERLPDAIRIGEAVRKLDGIRHSAVELLVAGAAADRRMWAEIDRPADIVDVSDLGAQSASSASQAEAAPERAPKARAS